MNNFPHVTVDFIIEGKNLEINKLIEEIGVSPTKIRGIDDWPEIIKNDSNLLEELQPRHVWCICQEMNLCKKIEIPINKIITQIKGKEQILFEFCKKNNLKKSLCITIEAETMFLPEIVLSPHIVSYFGKLDVEIGFDIYTY